MFLIRKLRSLLPCISFLPNSLNSLFIFSANLAPVATEIHMHQQNKKQKQLKNYKQTKGEKKPFFYQPSEPRSIYNVNHALPMVHHHCNLFTNRSNRILSFEEFNMLGILSSEGIAQSCGIFWNDTFHRSPPLVALLQKIPEEKNNHPTQKISIFNIFLWGFGKFTIPYIIPSHLTKYITNPEYSPKCQHLVKKN